MSAVPRCNMVYTVQEGFVSDKLVYSVNIIVMSITGIPLITINDILSYNDLELARKFLAAVRGREIGEHSLVINNIEIVHIIRKAEVITTVKTGSLTIYLLKISDILETLTFGIPFIENNKRRADQIEVYYRELASRRVKVICRECIYYELMRASPCD